MSTTVIVVIVMGLLFLLLASSIPVAFALMAAGALGIALLAGFGYAESALGVIPYRTPSQFTLVVVPLFIAMGMVARETRIAVDSFRLASRALRGIPGGLAVASIFACAGFAAVSGSSVATVAAIGRVASAEMRSYGYDRRLVAGTIATAGTLGILIPPSVILVLFGIITQQSIGVLLIAGIGPGVVTALVYSVGVVIRVKLNPNLVSEQNALEYAERTTGVRDETGTGESLPRTGGAAYVGVLEVAVLFAIVIGGIYTGVFTATESAALGALAALVILGLENWRSPKRLFRKSASAIRETLNVSAMSFALLIGGGLLSVFLVLAQVPQAVVTVATEIDAPSIVILLLLLACYIPLGMFLDPLSILLIAVPLTYPTVIALGYDGVVYTILVVIMIELGLITPPVGMNTFVVAGAVEDCSLEEAFRGIMWFIPLVLSVVGLILLFPGIVTWLPGLMRG